MKDITRDVNDISHPNPPNTPPSNAPERPDFTAEQLLDGTAIEYLGGIKNGYTRALEEVRLKNLSKILKVQKDFNLILRAFHKENEHGRRNSGAGMVFEYGKDQSVDLQLGSWNCDEQGIWKYARNDEMLFACAHPIVPVQIIRSVDTDTISAKLAFLNNYQNRKTWKTVTVPMSVISSAREITKLSELGVSVVGGQRAQALAEFLRDMIDLNADSITEVKSVSRLGWNTEGFAPYIGDVVFDGADSFRPLFRALTPRGSFDRWLAEARDARSYSVAARIMLAASFASVLVEPLGCLPFFVHLWSMESGTGKTVALMLAASVWGDPAPGGAYLQTFRSTSVGLEVTAGTLHSIPLCMDELQLAKDKNAKILFNVYELASGTGKLRSNKSLGMNYPPCWNNCFLTTGETPLIQISDGAGAVNRVIEINPDCGTAVIRDGHRTADVVRNNYGFAGKLFVERLLRPGGMEHAQAVFDELYALCMENDTTSKQAMSAALILTADVLATEWIFRDRHALAAGEIAGFLKDRSQVSAGTRGYETACDWVAVNEARFRDDAPPSGEHYGVIREQGFATYAVIIRKSWDQFCAENGISSRALLQYLRSKDLLLLDTKGNMTRTTYINGTRPACVWMKLPDSSGDEDGNIEEGDLPF